MNLQCFLVSANHTPNTVPCRKCSVWKSTRYVANEIHFISMTLFALSALKTRAVHWSITWYMAQRRCVWGIHTAPGGGLA